MNQMWSIDRSPSLMHHGVKGMKWGVWNAETRARYSGKDRVFISGKVKFDKPLPNKVKEEINQVMKANAQIIVGDAPGADTRVQKDIAMTNLATKAIAIMPKDDRPDSAMSKNIERLSNRNVKTTLYDFLDDTMNIKVGDIYK